MTSDRSQQKTDLPGTEPVANGHAMPEIAAPDLNWLPSDHQDVEDEDEATPDPWHVDIGKKEPHHKSADDTPDTLNGAQITDTFGGNSRSETMLPESGGQRNLFPKDDLGVQTGLFGNTEEKPPDQDMEHVPSKARLKLFNALDEWLPENDADSIGDDSESGDPINDNTLAISPTDISDPDWPGEESFDNEVDDGMEAFGLDEGPEDGFDIGEFDEDAQQTPWEPEKEDRTLRRAREKAAAIAILLDIRNTRERDNAVSYLTELFAQMTHSATFQAIKRTAEGMDFDTLKSMVEVRRVWMQRTDWWLGRYEPVFKISPLRHGDLALTWSTTRRVCLARKDHPPETMIDDEWLDEWLRLPKGAPGYLSFPSYIEEKVHYRNCELLNKGLQSKQQERDDGHVEIVNDFDW